MSCRGGRGTNEGPVGKGKAAVCAGAAIGRLAARKRCEAVVWVVSRQEEGKVARAVDIQASRDKQPCEMY